ncbi:MAG: hypothetical protein EBR52_04355 [Microbacteriaceae bacterium]|nr:hypothetical protein [Microbacteriaceae bacterium]
MSTDSSDVASPAPEGQEDEYELHLQDKVRFVTRGVTAEEKAAVIVALDKLVDEESALEHGLAASSESMWEKRRKGIRENVWLTRSFEDDFTV